MSSSEPLPDMDTTPAVDCDGLLDRGSGRTVITMSGTPLDEESSSESHNGWVVATRRSRSTKKILQAPSQQAKQTGKLSSSSQPTRAQFAQKLNVAFSKAARMPNMPIGEHKVVVRPRGGLLAIKVRFPEEEEFPELGAQTTRHKSRSASRGKSKESGKSSERKRSTSRSSRSWTTVATARGGDGDAPGGNVGGAPNGGARAGGARETNGRLAMPAAKQASPQGERMKQLESTIQVLQETIKKQQETIDKLLAAQERLKATPTWTQGSAPKPASFTALGAKPPVEKITLPTATSSPPAPPKTPTPPRTPTFSPTPLKLRKRAPAPLTDSEDERFQQEEDITDPASPSSGGFDYETRIRQINARLVKHDREIGSLTARVGALEIKVERGFAEVKKEFAEVKQSIEDLKKFIVSQFNMIGKGAQIQVETLPKHG
ncbi:hypothetical protein MRX96_017781 [Rhipicephalus microplus]